MSNVIEMSNKELRSSLSGGDSLISGSTCRNYWSEVAFSVAAAILLGHAVDYMHWLGALIIVGMIIAGFCKGMSYLWFALAASLYPLPSVPDSIGINECVFVFAFAAFALFSLRKFSSDAVGTVWRGRWFLIVAIIILLINYIQSTNTGVTAAEWFRGLAPFLLIAVGFPVYLIVRDTPKFYTVIAVSGVLISLLFAIRVLFVFWSEELWNPIECVYNQEIDRWVPLRDVDPIAFKDAEPFALIRRVTMVLSQSTDVMVVFAAIWGMILCYCFEGWKRLGGVLMIILGTIAITITQTRSMLLTCVLLGCCLIVYHVVWMRRTATAKARLKGLMIALAVTIITFYATIHCIEIDDSIAGRFRSLVGEGTSRAGFSGLGDQPGRVKDENVSARLVEYRIAWKMFSESPLFGKGLGAKHVMHFETGFGEIITREVAYVHNWVFYMLKSGGFSGLLLYTSLILFPLILIVKGGIFNRTVGLTVFLTIGCLVCYALFFAVFRLLPFNFVFGSTVGLAAGLYPKDSFLISKSSSNNCRE